MNAIVRTGIVIALAAVLASEVADQVQSALQGFTQTFETIAAALAVNRR